MATAEREILHPDINPEAWKEARRGLFTSSVAAAAFGKHPWVTAEELQKRKLGLLPPQEETEPMYRGRLLEPSAVQHFRNETGRPVERIGLRTHPDHPIIGATGDGWLPAHDGHPEAVLECKVPYWQEVSKIRRRGLQDYIVFQVQIEAAVFGVDYVICEVFDAERPRASMIFPIEADPDWTAELIGRMEEWWHRHILNREPVESAEPPEDMPEYEGEIVQLDIEEFNQSAGDYLMARDVAKEAEAVKKAARAGIAEVLDDQGLGYGAYEGGVARVYYDQNPGRVRHSQTVKAVRARKPLDPLLLVPALAEEFGPYPGVELADVQRALEAAADRARLDIDALEERGEPYDSIRVYRVKHDDG